MAPHFKENLIIQITTLEQVSKAGWSFKISECEERIMIFCYNDKLKFACMRYLKDQEKAKLWIDSLIENTEDHIRTNLLR